MNNETSRVNRRILLVDDDPLVVKVYAERMRYEGWTVAIARDGWEACQEAKREEFDVVLLDIRMPFSDGLDVLREIRNGGKNAETPVWILTSLSSGEQIEDSLRLGADGVFHKAATRPDDLVTELDRIFEMGRTPAHVGAAVDTGEPVRPRSPGHFIDPEEGDFEFESFRAGVEDEYDAPGPEDFAGDEPEPEAYVEDDRIFAVYVNPFLGEGKALAEAISLDASYQCRICSGQICLRLRVFPSGRGHEVGGAFVCSRCDEPA